jgi:hypothetical protein
MTREEALALSHKYEGEFPNHTIEAALAYMEMSEKEFQETVDKHREDWVWENDGEWKLRNSIV